MTSLENQERLFLVDSDLLPFFRAINKIPLQSYGDVKQIPSRGTDHYCLAIFAGIALKLELKLALSFQFQYNPFPSLPSVAKLRR